MNSALCVLLPIGLDSPTTMNRRFIKSLSRLTPTTRTKVAMPRCGTNKQSSSCLFPSVGINDRLMSRKSLMSRAKGGLHSFICYLPPSVLRSSLRLLPGWVVIRHTPVSLLLFLRTFLSLQPNFERVSSQTLPNFKIWERSKVWSVSSEVFFTEMANERGHRSLKKIRSKFWTSKF